MAESSLALGYPELTAEIGWALGYGRGPTWDSDKTTHIENILKEGVQQFYYPPPLPGEAVPHQWTFLRPIVSFNTVDGDYDYDLPDDFSGIEGDLTFDPGDGYLPVRLVGEADIRKLRQPADTPTSGRPLMAAVRPLTSDGTDGQRFELILHPTPDGVYTLNYRTQAIFSKLTTTNPYPLGGAVHARTVLKSCLAAVEDSTEKVRGTAWKSFVEALQHSVQHDRSQSPRNLGYNGDYSSERGKITYDRVSQVTYNGVAY